MSPEIAGRRVATGAPLFVIAEVGLNHGGDPAKAVALVDAAARAGASAVKLQTLRGDRLVAPACPAPAHLAAESMQAFFARFELDDAAHRAVADRARSLGLSFMSTPFDEQAVDRLERLGCDAYKIASGDVTHLRLIERAAATRKPLVISTGMSELDEVARAVACAQAAGAAFVALLHCVSAYPVPAGQENLAAIATLRDRFGLPVGLSDHSHEPLSPALTVALGGAIYERHLVLGPDDDAIDAAVSSTPLQLREIVATAARVHAALGSGVRTCGPAEAANRRASRRGLYAAHDLPAGHAVSTDDLVVLRPADGIDASRWREVVGRRLDRPVRAGEALPASLVSVDGAAACLP